MFFHHQPTYKKTALVIATAFCIGVFGGGIASVLSEPYTEGSVSFFVRNERRASEVAYDYEGYYTLKAADEAASALVSWLRSPGGVAAVYGDADVRIAPRKLRLYERVFDIRRDGTPFFEVRFKTASADEAQRLSAAVGRRLAGELVSLEGKSGTLSLGSTAPVLVARAVPYLRNLAYGALLAVLLAVFGLLFKTAAADNS